MFQQATYTLESLTISYSNYGSDAVVFIHRKISTDGTELYFSENTNVTATIEKITNGYKVTAHRNRDEYDFFGKQSKSFATLSEARKSVENGFKKICKFIEPYKD